MDLRRRRRDELSPTTVWLARVFAARRGQFVTALQIPFTAIYLPLLLALVLSSDIARPGLAWAGGLVTISASIFARYLQTRPTPGWAPATLCGACFAALGLLAAAAGSHGYLLAVLALMPATWLAYAYLWPGALWGVLATGVLMLGGALADTGEHPPLDGVFYVVLPLVVLAMTSACVLVTESWEVQRSQLHKEQARVDTALTERTATAVLLESMLDSMDSAVVAFDTQGETLLANASHLYPLSWAGPVGTSERLIFDEDSTTPVPADLYPSELAKRGITVEGRLLWFGTPGPAQRAVLATSRRMIGPDGAEHGVMVVYHDITSLMRAMRVKDDFVETVSHELRTPLTSILGYLELIRDDHDDAVNTLPEETIEYLAVVSRNSSHLLDLVSDLLTTAKSAADALRASSAPADLNRIVRRSVESAQLRFDAAGVALSCELEPVRELQINVRRISQVVDNILSNALKYTPHGGEVVVSTRARGEDVALVITDTGIGMSQSDLERMFDKFQRAQSATELHIPGIGLGLAISKSIVDAHRGSITMTSSLGEGTAVTVLLPAGAHGPEAGPLVSRTSALGGL